VPECDASAAPAIQRLGLETVVESDDFTVMVYALQAPGSDDWYLVDALGYVRVFSNGTLLPTPFLDVSSEVQDSTFGSSAPAGGSQGYDERGLLSIAFPPDYATSGKFYVTLIPTTEASDNTDHDFVLEYTRSASDPLVADPSSRKVIIDLEPGGDGYVEGMTFSYAKYHNASTALFGPDGMLYVGMGDGGGDCNAARPGVPQDVSSPYGKILRLDPSKPEPYAAEGNPFADAGDPRVYHYGVRNPFRFNFDPATGDIYIGEVGQWSHDSVAYAPANAPGSNFGWPAFEGTAENPTSQCASTTELRAGSTRTQPIFNLAHGSEGGVSNLIVAIVGGQVYRGSAIPELSGVYLFGEFYPNRPMRALYQCGSQTSEVLEIQKICDPNTPDAACFTPVGNAPDLRQVGAIVRGNDGELYLPANGNALLKIVPAPAP
jgi:glucose/arabinose dehydrogenase